MQNHLTPAVLLQTAAIILENPNTKQQVKVKVLLDAESQMTYISERIRKFLKLLGLTFGKKSNKSKHFHLSAKNGKIFNKKAKKKLKKSIKF